MPETERGAVLAFPVPLSEIEFTIGDRQVHSSRMLLVPSESEPASNGSIVAVLPLVQLGNGTGWANVSAAPAFAELLIAARQSMSISLAGSDGAVDVDGMGPDSFISMSGPPPALYMDVIQDILALDVDIIGLRLVGSNLTAHSGADLLIAIGDCPMIPIPAQSAKDRVSALGEKSCLRQTLV